jgi:hypothetical protein
MHFLPQRKHNTSVAKISWLMLFKEIITVYSENHTKPINIHSRQNAELLNVKIGGICSYHWEIRVKECDVPIKVFIFSG